MNNNCVNLFEQAKVTKRLLDLLDQTGCELVQENGQRIFSVRTNTTVTTPRMKGTEVFLGGIPRDCYEDELVPFLEKIGRVVQLRLMLDFSGFTRGFAFAVFEHQSIARCACQRLNGHEIRPGKRIGVVESMDNCRLFLSGFPKGKSRIELMAELRKIVKGVTNVELRLCNRNEDLNRGSLFAEFEDHKTATMAKRTLSQGGVLLCGRGIAVEWAEPQPHDLNFDNLVADTLSELEGIDLTDPDLHKAATKIQASFRGHKVRQEVPAVPVVETKK